MRRLIKAVTRRRSPSNNASSNVQISVPKHHLHVLASDLGMPPFKSGVLLKYTNMVKRWKLRHFTLENGVLNYCAASSDDEDEEPTTTTTTTTTSPSNNENANPNTLNPNASPNHPSINTLNGGGGGGASHDRSRRARKKSRRRRLLRRSSKEDNEKEIKGSINLQHAAITPDDSDSCRFAIDVGHDVYHCKAETRALRDEWVVELNRSIAYFKGLIQRAVARAKESPSTHATSTTGPPGPSSSATINANASSTAAAHAASSSRRSDRERRHGGARIPNGLRLNIQNALQQHQQQQHQQQQQQHQASSPHVTGSTPPVSPASTNNRSTGLSNGLLNSEDSEDTVYEDDGLREAEQGHRALVAELRRIVGLWRQRWMETPSTIDDEQNLLKTLCDTFADTASTPSAPASPSSIASSSATAPTTPTATAAAAPEVAKGLIDLLTWCLHVLQTNNDVFDRRLKEDMARRLAGGSPVFPHQPTATRSTRVSYFAVPPTRLPPLHEDSDGEFVDALSRAVSKRSSFARQAPSRTASRRGDNSPSSQTIVKNDGVEVEELPDEETASPTGGDTNDYGLKRIDTAALVRGQNSPRTHLPRLPGARERLNIFGILKDAVGKDLSKITLPVGLNEPLSFVQRLAEDIEYCELLDQAAAEPNPERRMMYVAAMVISHYSSTQGRVGKPFNPLLGETACLVRPDKGNGVRYIAEQVSHHPPISACYAEGGQGKWKYYNAIEVKNKFWGKSLEVFPTGLNHIEIPEYGDHYVLEQVTACVHNIVVGRLWLDNYGTMEIVNRTTGSRCKIEFNKTGWMSDARSFASIKGTVYNAAGKAAIKLGGNWTQSVYEDLGRGRKNVLWSVEDRPSDDASQSYNMTKWAISLNAEVGPAERPSLPPTDSRLRPDQRALEQGKLDLGSRLKQALEEGQRKRRREMEEAGKIWEPLWFEKVTDDVTGQTDYRFKGTFFKHQAAGDWSQCPDIFSPANSILNGDDSSSSSSPDPRNNSPNVN